APPRRELPLDECPEERPDRRPWRSGLTRRPASAACTGEDRPRTAPRSAEKRLQLGRADVAAAADERDLVAVEPVADLQCARKGCRTRCFDQRARLLDHERG